MSQEKKRTAYVVAHTHWDREWRYPIWETRLMLVDFIDELIDVLETGKYSGFLLDGHVAPILDYLKYRPEMEPRVKKLVSDGKLQIGPWYILPDEFPIDGESMVRNLLWGDRKSKELGGVFSVGYTPFGWGQTAQLPQLYANFGMDVAMIGKRVSKDRAPDCEFLWRAPDGSELISTRFGDLGRQNLYFKVHLSSLFGMNHEMGCWEYDWPKGGQAFHRADTEQMEQDHFQLDTPEDCDLDYITPEILEETWATMDESLMPNDRLMMNGCDYTASQPLWPKMLKRLNELDKDTDRQWIDVPMGEYVKLMTEKLDKSKLKLVEGELRDGPSAACTANALSTRLYLKRLNKYAQNKLIRFAEPLSVLATMNVGAEFPAHMLNTAWDYLLTSHPHDSINGVTQDKTANDVYNRLEQVIDISQSLGNRAMQELVKKIDTSAFNDEDILITVFNPSPYPRTEVLQAWVNMPIDHTKDYRSYTPDGPQVYDAEGNAMDTQWHGSTQEEYCVAELHTRAFPYYCNRHRIFFDSGTIPAGGYKIFRVADKNEITERSERYNDIFARTNTLLQSPNMMENKYLRVEMNSNGTFNLTDKENGKVYENMNYYEDRGEHGTYWINQRPMFDQAHTSIACPARVWSQDCGPIKATLASEVTMSVPKRGDKELQKRGDEIVELKIVTKVTLDAGSRQINVEVEFDNNIEDHFLRAMFPTGLSEATTADAGGHFTVDHRPIKTMGPDDKAHWPDMGTQPQNNFVDVSDSKCGIAFINDSLTEYEVMDNAERTVGLSLVRGVRNWIVTETRVGSTFPSQKGGQSLGQQKIRYAIRPHAGNWLSADVATAAEQFNVPVIPVQTRSNEGTLPAKETSLFAIDNSDLRFSVLKKAEDSDNFMLRVYNPTCKDQKAVANFSADIKAAWKTNLNEERLGNLTAKDNGIHFTVTPGEITTVEIEMA